MEFFRSEEHIARWLEENGWEPGATLTTQQLSDLANAWWGSRLDPDWTPRPPEESQAILEGLGLTGPFWRLA